MLTRSRFMLSMALSMPLTTDAKLPVICRIVTAVSTRLATASTRLERRSKFKASFFLRIAFAAYILAPSVLPCWSAFKPSIQSRAPSSMHRTVHTFFRRLFSLFSSFCAFLDCLVSDFAVNYGPPLGAILAVRAMEYWTLSWKRVSKKP